MTQYYKSQPVTINGQPWLVTEHKEGSATVWATRADGDGSMSVAHKLEDVQPDNDTAALPVYSRSSSGATPEQIAAKRKAWQEKQQKGEFAPPDATFTPPRYDEVYWEAMATLDREIAGYSLADDIERVRVEARKRRHAK